MRPGRALLGAALCGLSSCTDPTVPTGAPLLTDATVYTLDFDGRGYAGAIPYSFTNTTGGKVFIVNCHGSFALHLERRQGDDWRMAWGPVLPLCLSAPIVIRAGEVFRDTVQVWGAPPGADFHPQFDVAEPSGTYRLVWSAALSSYDPEERHFGDPIAEEFRISNSFHLQVR